MRTSKKLYFRPRDPFWTATTLLAFSLALLMHGGALFIFKIRPPSLPRESSIHASTSVVATIPPTNKSLPENPRIPPPPPTPKPYATLRDTFVVESKSDSTPIAKLEFTGELAALTLQEKTPLLTLPEKMKQYRWRAYVNSHSGDIVWLEGDSDGRDEIAKKVHFVPQKKEGLLKGEIILQVTYD